MGLTKAQKAARARQAQKPSKLILPKTPAAQIGSDAPYPEDDEEDEVEVNAGAMEPNSEPNDADANEPIRLPFSDFPDVPASSRNGDTSEVGDAQQDSGAAADMGANGSHEDFSRNIRSAAAQLQKENKTTSEKGQGIGKLVRPSAKLPAYRNPVSGTIKKLPRANNIRKSTYDLEGSPEKPALPATIASDTAPFSPIRKQRQARRAEEQTHASPRRSGRAQPQQDDRDDAAEPEAAASKRQSQAGAEQNAVYIDRFPDPVVQRYHLTDSDARVGADQAENIDVANKDSEHAPSVEKAKRKRGRPPKVPNNAEAAQPQPKKGGHQKQHDRLEQSKATEEAVAKRGRPPKRGKAADANLSNDQGTASNTTAAQTTPQRSAPNTISKSHTPSSARAQHRLEELAQQYGQRVGTQSDLQLLDLLPQSKNVSKEQLSRRRSNRTQQLEDLNRRRNAEPNAEPAEADPPVELNAEEPIVAQQPRTKAQVIRPSEMVFNADNAANPGDEVEEAGHNILETSNSQREKRKRKAPSQSTQANTGAKRRRKVQVDDDDDDEREEQQDSTERRQAKERRLWGQWLPLKRIHRDLKNVGAYDIALEGEDIGAVVDLCNKAETGYEHMQDGKADADAEPAGILNDIGRRIDGLRGLNEDFPTDFKKKTKTTNIYFHVIPSLVKLLWSAVLCYDTIDSDELGRISTGHLRIVTGLIHMTLDMESAAEDKYKARPDSSDAVVRPVHNGIAVPLRKVQHVFQRVLQQHEAGVRATQRQEQEAQDRALRLEQEERRNRQKAKLDRDRKKWEQLHCERMICEGGFIRPDKMAHLKMPDPSLDVDYDGAVFDRVQLFHPRVGPPPGLVDEAKNVYWTEGELRALVDGLTRYAGPMVFERTFRAWSPRGFMLNRFNVTQIVTEAAIVKEQFTRAQEELDGQVKEWVKAIPVWTKSQGVGQENEDWYADVDEVVGGQGDEQIGIS